MNTLQPGRRHTPADTLRLTTHAATICITDNDGLIGPIYTPTPPPMTDLT